MSTLQIEDVSNCSADELFSQLDAHIANLRELDDEAWEIGMRLNKIATGLKKEASRDKIHIPRLKKHTCSSSLNHALDILMVSWSKLPIPDSFPEENLFWETTNLMQVQHRDEFIKDINCYLSERGYGLMEFDSVLELNSMTMEQLLMRVIAQLRKQL